MNKEKSTIDRRVFVSRFMREGGVTYSVACRLYEIMCNTIADGIVTGNRVTFGRVGALKPVWRPPRELNMHFRCEKGRKIKRGVTRTYFMDGRYDFKFRLFRQFINQHQLRWFTDLQQSQ